MTDKYEEQQTNDSPTEWWFDSSTDVKQLREYIHGLERRRDQASVRWGDAENRAAVLTEVLVELQPILTAAFSDLTTGEAIFPEQTEPIADALAGVMVKARAALAAPEPTPRVTATRLAATEPGA